MEKSNNLGSSALNLSLATLGQTATQFCGLKFLGDGSHGRSGAVIRLAPTYASASFQVRGEDKDLASVVWEIALAAFQAVAAEPPRASPAEFVEGLNRTLKIVAAASDNDPQSSLYWRFGRIR